MGDEYERSICTDAACPSNPWPIEYRGVDIASGKELFSYGPYDWWSVNIGEFLAIVEGIRRCICHPEWNEGTSQLKNSWLFSDWTLPSSGRQKNWKTVLYTDSKIALSRTLKGNINTTIRKTKSNILLFEKIQQAEEWLQYNSHRPQFMTLKKRPTSQWGQIPADFGRK